MTQVSEAMISAHIRRTDMLINQVENMIIQQSEGVCTISEFQKKIPFSRSTIIRWAEHNYIAATQMGTGSKAPWMILNTEADRIIKLCQENQKVDIPITPVMRKKILNHQNK